MAAAPNSPKPPKPGVLGVRSDTVKAEAIEWLDPDDLGERIPLGMLTLIAGRPGQGKSLFSADLTARVSNKVGAVIFSNLEDPLAQVVRPRLEAAGAKLDMVHFWNPILPRDTEALRTMIVALGVKLVIIDPVAAHLTVSIYNDQEVRQALTPLAKVAADTGCAIVLISHTLKSARAKSHPLESIGGSGGGLAGSSRVVYIFGPDPNDSSVRALGWAKINIATPPPALQYELDESEWVVGSGAKSQVIRTGRLVLTNDSGPDSLEYAAQLAAGTPFLDKNDIPAEKKAIAAEWLTDYLAGGEQPATQIREDAADDGITFATLRRAADEIGVAKARHGFGPGSYLVWMLPEGHPDLIVQGDEEPAEGVEGVEVTETGEAEWPADPDAAQMDVDEILADIEKATNEAEEKADE